jgi:quercetin dioxygenase-like cupin family protein
LELSMKPVSTAVFFLGLGVVLGAASMALAQPEIPAPTGRPQGKVLGSIDLGPEFAALKGHTLDMDRAVLETGAERGFHAHNSEPEIVYVESGVLTDQRRGGPISDHGPGSVLSNAGGVLHAVINRGSEPVVFYVASIRPAAELKKNAPPSASSR